MDTPQELRVEPTWPADAQPPPLHEYQPGPFRPLYPPVYPVQQVVFTPARANGLGVAGFVTGLVGLLLFWVPGLGIVSGALGLILGGVGISTARKDGSSAGLAIAGLVLGIISIIPAVLVLTALSNAGL